MRLKYGLVVVLGSIFSLSSCGDGGTDTASNNTIESVVNAETTAPFVFPTDATTLQNALTTQHASVDDFDVWLCTPQGASSPEIAYELPVAGTLGAGLVGREYVLSTGEESLFTWQVPSSTELVTTTLDTGVVSNTTNYQFGGDSSFSFAFNSTGFTCNRVDNTVAFGGAPTTSDNNNNGTTDSSLADENAKIPNANRPVSAVQKIINRLLAQPPYSKFVPKMMMTFPGGYSTDCMEWDMLSESPTPGSIGDRCDLTLEPQDDTPLQPFQAGERINASFGSLSATGFQVPNVINSSLIQKGELVINDAGEIGISSTTYSYLQSGGSSGAASGASGAVGTYYLDGYTITIKFSDGTIRHQYIGVLNRENGSVTSLMLGNEFYSDGL